MEKGLLDVLMTPVVPVEVDASEEARSSGVRSSYPNPLGHNQHNTLFTIIFDWFLPRA